jgi:predicted exporter
MSSNSTRASLALIAWVVVLAASLAITLRLTSDRGWLHSNVFELLPESDYDPLAEAATRAVDAELGTRLLFFIGHQDRAVAMSAADQLAGRLRGHPRIAEVTARIDKSRFADLASFYFPYRRQILSDAQLRELADDPDGIERRALANVYSPFGMAGSLETDPFSLFPGSLQALQPAASALHPDAGYLWAARDGIEYAFIQAHIDSPKLSVAEQENLARHIDAAIDGLSARWAGLDVLRTGFAFYANAATQQARNEVSTIGLGSLVGLVLLVVATFRSLRPLALIIVSIIGGCAVALAMTLSVFGFVHLFTLVFGASLIGVSVDYSFHYVADDAFGDRDWTPRRGLRNIFMGITLGLLTSVLAYLALTVAPFPGLRQLAVFSSAGLAGAYLTLVSLFWLWRRRSHVPEKALMLRLAERILQTWGGFGRRQHLVLSAIVLLLLGFGYRGMQIDDDVASLQSQPAELRRQESGIQQLLGIAQAGTFLMLSSTSDENLLELEESVRERLVPLLAAGTLSGYQAVSRWVPSIARQRRSHAAYTALLESHLPAFFDSLGVGDGIAVQTLRSLTADMSTLDIDTWLESPVSGPARGLWLGSRDGGAASIILLFGLADIDAIVETVAPFPTVTVVNKAREMSTLFGQYRARVAEVLVAAYLLILAGLAIRYGLRRAATVLLPPVLAGLLALSLISLAGETLNLFNFLAMILVLGIGIDFTIFIAEARGDLRSTMFAITLSALTTMLSFGLLSLSSTYAVHSFGLTVLLGIACAYLLSPLALPGQRGQ